MHGAQATQGDLWSGVIFDRGAHSNHGCFNFDLDVTFTMVRDNTNGSAICMLLGYSYYGFTACTYMVGTHMHAEQL